MSARRLVVLTLVSVAGLLAGCSSSDSPTNPGGGGGGGGPTFMFSFPAVGSSSSQVFATAGTYTYACMAHGSSGMTGTVNVSASSVLDSAVVLVGVSSPSNPANQFSPSTVTIKPGRLVRWLRDEPSSAGNHSAMR